MERRREKEDGGRIKARREGEGGRGEKEKDGGRGRGEGRKEGGERFFFQRDCLQDYGLRHTRGGSGRMFR